MPENWSPVFKRKNEGTGLMGIIGGLCPSFRTIKTHSFTLHSHCNRYGSQAQPLTPAAHVKSFSDDN